MESMIRRRIGALEEEVVEGRGEVRESECLDSDSREPTEGDIKDDYGRGGGARGAKGAEEGEGSGARGRMHPEATSHSRMKLGSSMIPP